MEDRGYITPQISREACEDAKVNSERVQDDSLNAMIGAAVAFEWFWNVCYLAIGFRTIALLFSSRIIAAAAATAD